MPIVAKSFLHSAGNIVSTSGDADGKLAEDIQDWITSQDAELVATTNLNVTCTQFGQNIFTLVVLDSD
tara:strand:- start:714 stop:917 length:204 start_codon:yes stop_codon:yes gene_type:complete